MTHVEALDLDRLPEHLIVLGGGYVALELSQALRRFGSRVAVIQTASQFADLEDPDVGAALLDLFRDEGIDVLLGSHVRQVDGRSGRRVTVEVESGKEKHVLGGTDILVAFGRTPNTDALDLEKAGVQTDENGYIRVNEGLLTTCENVWAMGDCAGGSKLTHVSVNDFLIVKANLTGASRTRTARLVPFCMFTDPDRSRTSHNRRYRQGNRPRPDRRADMDRRDEVHRVRGNGYPLNSYHPAQQPVYCWFTLLCSISAPAMSCHWKQL